MRHRRRGYGSARPLAIFEVTATDTALSHGPPTSLAQPHENPNSTGTPLMDSTVAKIGDPFCGIETHGSEVTAEFQAAVQDSEIPRILLGCPAKKKHAGLPVCSFFAPIVLARTPTFREFQEPVARL